jgi:glycosyltransferase involved in cell wall biosynthesis
MKEPLVSIIIPVYNGSNYMCQAIDSALAQTYKNTEVIVVNDGSTDGGATDEVARSYGDRIRYYYKENGGVSSALNFGIEKMSGEYFSWLSHDDLYEADKVEKQVAALVRYHASDNTLVYSDSIHVDENANPLPMNGRGLHFADDKMYDSGEVLTKLLTEATFNGCGLLIPKKAFVECGNFDENLRFCQDAFMWYQIFIKNFSLIYVDEVLTKIRVHGGQLTQTGQSLFRKECNEISKTLVDLLTEISTLEKNFLTMYLLCDARHFKFKRVGEIIKIGKKSGLISFATTIKAYLICAYGKVRPCIRWVYYKFIKRITIK